MKIYFAPLACSLASRIACFEAGADVTFIEVDSKTKQASDGVDFRSVNPLGLVPTLALDDGEILTENAAILQYIAERFPDAALAPTDVMGRARLRQWLSFVGTELHKSLYVPLLDKTAPEGARAFALSKSQSRLAWVSAHLEGRQYVLDRFSVADAYLFAVLNWSAVTPVDLAPWPAITAYHKRLHERPSVARAFAEERTLYGRELARQAATAPSAPPA
jgi:glutathione S-transferase